MMKDCTENLICLVIMMHDKLLLSCCITVYVQKYTEVEEGHSSVELFICFADNKLDLRGNRK